MKIRQGGLAVLLVLCATTASADAASSVAVPDGCGDASKNVVAVNDTGVPVDTGRAGTYDIDSGTLTAVTGGGVDAQLKACGAIPATADQIGGSWQLSAGVADGCTVSFVLADTPEDGRQGGLSVYCPSVLETPVQNFYGASEVFSRVLRSDEWSVSGNAVNFHLSAQGLRAAHVGNTWSDPWAHTWDGARGTQASQDPGAFYWGVNGPGVTDEAHGTGTLDLG